MSYVATLGPAASTLAPAFVEVVCLSAGKAARPCDCDTAAATVVAPAFGGRRPRRFGGCLPAHLHDTTQRVYVQEGYRERKDLARAYLVRAEQPGGTPSFPPLAWGTGAYEIYLFVGWCPFAAAQAQAAKHNARSRATDRVRTVAMPSPFSLSPAGSVDCWEWASRSGFRLGVSSWFIARGWR